MSDLDELAVLFSQYREFQGKAPDPLAARGFLQARLNNGESAMFMAREEHSAVGFAQVYPSFSSVALARIFILNDRFVPESGRRKGVASQLLALVESYARSRDAVRVTLNVDRNNIQAQALYEARGWSPDLQFCMYHCFPGEHRMA